MIPPAQDTASGAQSILVINTDVTERKALESQLQRAQRLESIGVLAGGIAHDLNNVLTPILMASELLMLRATDAESRSLLTMLQASTERGAELVKQILTFARGTEGERQVLYLPPLCKEVGKLLTQTFPKSISIATDVPQDLWLISGDAAQVHQVLTNLCVNARDAMPQGGTLRLSAQRGGRRGPRPGVAPRRPSGVVRGAGGARQRQRHRACNPRPHLRSVLHDQGDRQGHRPGTVNDFGHRQERRRLRDGSE